MEVTKKTMQIAMIGLGKMGANMTVRLLNDGHNVVAFDLNDDAVRKAEAAGAVGARTLDEVVAKMKAPRVVWVMVPAGKATESTVQALADRLSPGDLIIDGGNSNFKGTMELGASVEARGLHFVDVGTSGGVWGLKEGYSMMVGGSDAAVALLRPALETLAPASDKGWGHVGPIGSGHFVKMVHNGIEYGMMAAFAEGFALMRKRSDYGLDLAQIAEIWRHGSVVRSWLLDLTAEALAENPEMDDIAPYVTDSGEGRWTVFEAIDQNLSTPIITLSLLQRLRSREEEGYTEKLLSAMRNKFGGHSIKKTV
ncbi:MAG: decarboxylating 6-phosphogluconate dehydrogenase [Rhodothermales bacterium]|nr:decarboxylating 6-phosphogluconate dehydrogenase [Rhodothermales bacterium]